MYIHGIGNKPIASVLKRQWDEALFGVNLGERSRMAYWVNRDYYPIPAPADVPEGKLAPLPEPDKLAVELYDEVSPSGALDEDVQSEVNALSKSNDDRRRQLTAIALKMQSVLGAGKAAAIVEEVSGPSEAVAEILPTAFLRRIVTRNLTRAFLRDAHDFLYVEKRRQQMEASLRERLLTGGPFVVIGHSQGSLIAYKVLTELKNQVEVPLFVTIGSPLGIEEVQDVLIELIGEPLRVPQCVGRWVNVADRLDPIAADVTLGDDYDPRGNVAVEDVHKFLLNPDSPRHPHSGTGYLSTQAVRHPVQQAVGPEFAAAVSSFAVARDVADAIENQLPNERLNVLIELRQLGGTESLADQRTRVIKALSWAEGFSPEVANLEELERFIAVKLTRREIEHIGTQLTNLNLGRVWRDSEKMSLVTTSCDTIHVRPAWDSFHAYGDGVCWAVLDTGIADDHPHFATTQTVRSQWNCTEWNRRGEVTPLRSPYRDANGHGTHVAAIIAGRYNRRSDGGNQGIAISGMAPNAKLVSYKVLDDTGRGRDSWIIKALQHIERTNNDASELAIHGINLSLGGNFDPTVYACGHSPLCNELRRLWRQGVLVCIAAGNRGLTELQTRNGFLTANLDLTIGDPANLDETIAVGSVHKRNPYTYGISYFSSRGPTADGRVKPDVLAPGEKILSANHRFQIAGTGTFSDLYVEQSGTSMAAPHISGMLACFLSMRREYIGYPDRVKRILLDSCSSLGRDAYSEGRGLPSLLKMLTNA